MPPKSSNATSGRGKHGGNGNNNATTDDPNGASAANASTIGARLARPQTPNDAKLDEVQNVIRASITDEGKWRMRLKLNQKTNSATNNRIHRLTLLSQLCRKAIADIDRQVDDYLTKLAQFPPLVGTPTVSSAFLNQSQCQVQLQSMADHHNLQVSHAISSQSKGVTAQGAQGQQGAQKPATVTAAPAKKTGGAGNGRKSGSAGARGGATSNDENESNAAAVALVHNQFATDPLSNALLMALPSPTTQPLEWAMAMLELATIGTFTNPTFMPPAGPAFAGIMGALSSTGNGTGNPYLPNGGEGLGALLVQQRNGGKGGPTDLDGTAPTSATTANAKDANTAKSKPPGGAQRGKGGDAVGNLLGGPPPVGTLLPNSATNPNVVLLNTKRSVVASHPAMAAAISNQLARAAAPLSSQQSTTTAPSNQTASGDAAIVATSQTQLYGTADKGNKEATSKESATVAKETSIPTPYLGALDGAGNGLWTTDADGTIRPLYPMPVISPTGNVLEIGGAGYKMSNRPNSRPASAKPAAGSPAAAAKAAKAPASPLSPTTAPAANNSSATPPVVQLEGEAAQYLSTVTVRRAQLNGLVGFLRSIYKLPRQTRERPPPRPQTAVEFRHELAVGARLTAPYADVGTMASALTQAGDGSPTKGSTGAGFPPHFSAFNPSATVNAQQSIAGNATNGAAATTTTAAGSPTTSSVGAIPTTNAPGTIGLGVAALNGTFSVDFDINDGVDVPIPGLGHSTNNISVLSAAGMPAAAPSPTIATGKGGKAGSPNQSAPSASLSPTAMASPSGKKGDKNAEIEKEIPPSTAALNAFVAATGYGSSGTHKKGGGGSAQKESGSAGGGVDGGGNAMTRVGSAPRLRPGTSPASFGGTGNSLVNIINSTGTSYYGGTATPTVPPYMLSVPEEVPAVSTANKHLFMVTNEFRVDDPQRAVMRQRLMSQRSGANMSAGTSGLNDTFQSANGMPPIPMLNTTFNSTFGGTTVVASGSPMGKLHASSDDYSAFPLPAAPVPTTGPNGKRLTKQQQQAAQAAADKAAAEAEAQRKLQEELLLSDRLLVEQDPELQNILAASDVESLLAQSYNLYMLPCPKGVDNKIHYQMCLWRSQRMRLENCIGALEEERLPLQKRVDGVSQMSKIGWYSLVASKSRVFNASASEQKHLHIRSSEDLAYQQKLMAQAAQQQLLIQQNSEGGVGGTAINSNGSKGPAGDKSGKGKKK